MSCFRTFSFIYVKLHLQKCSKLSSTFLIILGNGRVAFDFKSIGKSPDSFNPLGADVDNKGMIYTADYQNSIWVINPRYYF